MVAVTMLNILRNAAKKEIPKPNFFSDPQKKFTELEKTKETDITVQKIFGNIGVDKIGDLKQFMIENADNAIDRQFVETFFDKLENAAKQGKLDEILAKPVKEIEKTVEQKLEGIKEIKQEKKKRLEPHVKTPKGNSIKGPGGA